MRKLPLIFLALTFAAPAAAQQVPIVPASAGVSPTASPVFRMVIAPDVFESLDALADTLSVETVRCLIGVVSDSAYVDLAWQPPIELSTPNRVRYRPCPSATIALWHTHPTSELGPEYACYLSRRDILEALRPEAPPIQIVQVNSRVACWWTRTQIRRARDEPILWPLPTQRRGGHVTLTSACDRIRTIAPCALAYPCAEVASGRNASDRACRKVVAAEPR